LHRTRVDDTLDVFACHGVGGVVGSLLTGVFARTAVNPNGADGLLAGNPELLGVQALSVLATGAWAALGTLVVLGLVRLFTPLRTEDEATEHGVDFSQHAEVAYVIEPGLEGLIRRRISSLTGDSRS
jgi:Amt family ammonium transporter